VNVEKLKPLISEDIQFLNGNKKIQSLMKIKKKE
jgi:hypothetical protein